MKITSLEEYGLRCMIQLAESGEQGPMSVTRIADNEGLSVQYAGKLLNLLRHAGLVDSVRGRNGGFVLARPAEEISIADIVRSLSDDLFDGEYCDRYSGIEDRCVHVSGCSLRPVWVTLSKMINRTLESLTLNDLLRPERQVYRDLRPHVEAIPAPRLPRPASHEQTLHKVRLPDAS